MPSTGGRELVADHEEALTGLVSMPVRDVGVEVTTADPAPAAAATAAARPSQFTGC
ncbi:MAG: hypothetical protein ACRD0F_01085 [Acidimicrobiales bacterium]